jgi:hypothetical protein
MKPVSDSLGKLNKRNSAIGCILFQICRVHGIQVFKTASQNAWLSWRFAFFAKRLERHPEDSLNQLEFQMLYYEFPYVTHGTGRRYLPTLLDLETYGLSATEITGCMNESCPEKSYLLGLSGNQWEEITSWDKERITNFWFNCKLCQR